MHKIVARKLYCDDDFIKLLIIAFIIERKKNGKKYKISTSANKLNFVGDLPIANNLILEDPPLFSSNGEKRVNYYNYRDLSTVCHNFINQGEEKDFVYYYFINQYCWKFFPENSRDKIRSKLGEFALKYRNKHPDKTLKVPFWPKKFLEGFNGLNDYDPYFGENFYNDSFNSNIDYEKLLANIKCNTLFMKANTIVAEDGLIQGALSDEDLKHVTSLIKNIKVEYFDCGHGIHSEKPKEFIRCVNETLA